MPDAGDHLSLAAGHSRSYLARSRPGRSRMRTPLMVIGVAAIGYVIWVASSKPPRPADPALENPIAGMFTPKKTEDPTPPATAAPAAAPSPAPTTTTPPPAPKKPIPVDLTPPKSRPSVGPSGTHIERSADTVVQWADKTDPSRLAGEFSYSKLEPVEAKRYLVSEPRAWMFLKDGWSIFIQSESGRVYIPDEQATKRPESGTLRGHVIIKAFKPLPNNARPDPAKDEAYLVAETDSLVFDGSVGELSTPDRLVAHWAQGYFAGRGLTAVFNEIKSRVEFAEIKEGEELVIHPTPKENKLAVAAPAPVATNSSATPRPPSPGPASTTPAAAPTESLYRGLFTSNVKITQAKRTLTADQLELWARLVDGKFPADAFGAKSASAAPATSTPSANSPTPAATNSQPALAAQKPAAEPETDPSLADMRLTWTGPLQIRISDTAIPQLDHDSLAMRFSSTKPGAVTAIAEDLNATARCTTLDYFASRRQLNMLGDGPDGVVVAMEKSGTATSSNLTADLARGSVLLAGPGTLQGASALAIAQSPTAADGKSTVAWTQQSELLFDQNSSPARLKEAIFTGDVNATDHDSCIKGELLRAEFTHLADAAMLSRITVQNHAVASDGNAGEIRGDHLDARFKPLARQDKAATPALEILQARGNVFAKKANDQIHAGFLDAHFISDPEKTALSTALARDDVRLDSADVHATAAELNFDANTQIATLTGLPSVPASAQKGPTTITGPVLTMDGLARTLAVAGIGTLSHTEPAKMAGAAASNVFATWTTSLAFDDRLGTANLEGDVNTTWRSDPASLDILKSRSLALKFTPFTDTPQDPPSAAAAPPPRELLHATAIGTDEVPATLESRRYNPADSGPLESRKPDRVNYLEGATILADNVKGTLDVPVRGKFLVSDRRPGAQAQSSGSFSGDALFHWTDSLHVIRDSEIADMRGNVEVIHLRPGDADATEMRCEQVTATMRHPPTTAPAPTTPPIDSTAHKNEIAMRGEISHIVAKGKVWARSATRREVTADIMDYDAVAGMMNLTGNDGREISAFDPSSGTPIRGRSLEWDLKLDRIRVKDVGGISVPR